ncbi:MAG: T9SS type A sorting domain-containing protein [Bacteroidales bacterium]|jgi:hypothetical protein|nr:T9SS type A sorting domain-containing protein [Bacteroidales bacterium]
MKNDFYLSVILISISILFAYPLKSQIKIHDDQHISLMSLTKSGGIQIQPSGYTYFSPQLYNAWAWMNLTYAKHQHSKSYIVQMINDTIHTFCVLGNGGVYYTNLLAFSNRTGSESKSEIENASEIISKLNGRYFAQNSTLINYDSLYKDLTENKYVSKDAIEGLITDYSKKEIGLIAGDIEKVLPDAIRTFSDGRKAIDYNAIIVVLVEAFKEQQEEINYLRRLIEKSDGDAVIKSENIDDNSINQISYAKSILHQNTPNPFNTSTNIDYEINEDIKTNAALNIYNLQGTLLKSYPVSQGKGSIQISANEYSAGMYLYSLIVNNKEIDTKKMILTK